VARELRLDIDSDASGARRGLDSAADGVDRLRREADRLESEFRETARAAEGLDDQLAETRVSTAKLAAEFAKSGDLGVKKQLTAQRAALRDLERLRADIVGDTERDANRAAAAYEKAFAKLRIEEERATAQAERNMARATATALREAAKRQKEEEKRRRQDDGGGRDRGFFGFFGQAAKVGAAAGVDAASTFSSAFQSGIMGAFKSLPAPAQAGIIAGLLAAVTAAAPIIATTISAAILLGVGSAGIAGGIALAVNNAQVKAAFAGLGAYAMAVLRDAAKPFQSELIDASRIFGAALDRNSPELRSVFATLSQAVQPLARGLAGLVTNALPGIRRAAAAAVPLFKELGKELPRLGKAISFFFDRIAEAGPGAVAVFKFILIAVEALIMEFGIWLSQMGQIAAGLGAIFDVMMPGSRATEEFADTWATAMATVETSTEDTRRSVIKLKIDMDELFGKQMDAREAAIAYEQALDDLAKGFKRGSDALDINNQKGRDNLTLINDTINAARDQLKADLEAAAGNEEAIAAANARYQAQLDRLREVLRALGLNEQAIEDLIGIAGAIPRDVTIDVSLFGARAAIGMLNSLGSAIARVAGVGHVGASAKVEMKRRALGGPVVKGEPYIVGDGGRPEVFVPDQNGRILPDASALARHAVAANGSAGRSGTPSLRYSGTPRGLEVMFLSWLQKQIEIGQLQVQA
jgi:hypothetical protein